MNIRDEEAAWGEAVNGGENQQLLHKGSPTENSVKGIWALPVRGGGSQPLPGWPIALIAALKISAKSAPECPFECGGGGAKAIRAMPKCLLRYFLWGFPKSP